MSAAPEQKSTKGQPGPARKPRRRRRWLQFSVLSLLLLTLVAAVFCALLSYELPKHKRRAAALKHIAHLGGHVKATPKYPALVDNLLGVQIVDVESIVFDENTGNYESQELDQEIPWVDEFPELQELAILHFWGADSPVAFARLKKAKALKKLTIGFTEAKVLVELLNELENLERLEGVTDIAELSDQLVTRARKLRDLDLTIWCEADSATIRGLPSVEELHVSYQGTPPRLLIAEMPCLKRADIEAFGAKVELRNLPKLSELALASEFTEVRMVDVPSLEVASFESSIALQAFFGTHWPNARVQLDSASALRRLRCEGVQLVRQPEVEFSALEDLTLIESALPDLRDSEWSRLKRLEFRNRSQNVPEDVRSNYARFWNSAPPLDRLEELTAQCRELAWQNAVNRFPRLRKLDLRYDVPDDSLEIRDLADLRNVVLHAPSGLERLAVHALPQLEGLQIDECSCRTITLDRLPRLQTVELSVEHVDEFTVRDVPSLANFTFAGYGRYISPPPADAAANRTRLSIQGAPSLRHMDLSRVDLAPSDWQGLDDLRSLKLSDSSEPQLTLRQWQNLKSLKLCESSISWRTILGLLFARDLESREIVLPGMSDKP